MTASLPAILARRSLPLLVWIFLLAGLYLTSIYNYILFHVLAEFFSIVIAIAIFMIAWNTRHLSSNNYVLFLGIALLFAGLVDFVHMLTYKGMAIFSGYDANLPTQLWIIARYLESISFLAAPWFIDRKLNAWSVFIAYLSVTSLLVAAAFSGTVFPDCYIEGQGLTPFKVISEYVICLILAGALLLLLRRRDRFDPTILRYLALSIACTIVSEVAFTFYVSVFGLSNLVGHFFKIFAFYLIYKTIVVEGLVNPFRLLFYDLEKQREELQVIIDSSPIMIFYKDRENRFIRVNRALAETAGLPRESVEGRTVREIFPGATSDFGRDDGVAASGTPRLASIEPMETPAGTRWVQTDTIPYRDKEGSIVGSIGFSVDITERRRAEEELRQSEEKYRNLFENMAEEVHFWQIVRDEKGRIDTWRLVDANPPTLKTWGRKSVEEIRGKTTDEIFGPGATEHYMPVVQKITTEGVPYSFEDYFPNLDRYFRFTSVPFGDYFITTGADITGMKKVEMELRERTSQMEETNRELESFSYSISHDLRAPLRAIDGFSRIILRRLGHDFDGETARQFGHIRSNAQMMGRLIDELLAFSRLSRAHLEVADLDVEAMIREVSTEQCEGIHDRTIELRISGVPRGTGDRTLIRQVVTNLMANAVKFTRLREPAVIEWGGYSQGLMSVYYVRDNGVGFDMTYYDKLFGVFQRLHNAEEFEGTGVGLAIVQRIIHRHGGHVWAEGKVDGGATIFFSLPAAQVSASHP